MDTEEFSEEGTLVPSVKKNWIKRIPARYVLMFLGFLGFCNIYALRVILSVAIVSMVNNTALLKDLGTENRTESYECHNDRNTGNHSDAKDGEFVWDSGTREQILGAFFYGYILTQIPGGKLAEVVGGKWLYGIGVLITGVLTLLTPIAARWHESALIAVRILEGFGEGVTFPAMHALLAHWMPKTERSSASSLVYSGAQIGTVIAMPISGALCASDFLGGWPSVFYVFGTLTVIWFVFWAFLVYDAPEDHPRISLEELTYIQTSQGEEKATKKPPTPWKSIVTSVPVWALAFAHFGQNCGFYMLLTQMPTYLGTILHMDIKDNGNVSALPYVLQALFNWFFGYVADFVRTKGYISTTVIRKLWNSVGFYGPGLCLVGVALAGCNKTLTIALFVLGMGFNGLIFSGFMVTHIDMAPDFAGTLMGITNAVATIPGFLAPIIVGVMTENEQSLRVWSHIFYIAAACYFVTNTVFIIFGSAKLQPWGVANLQKDSNDDKPKEIAVNSKEL